MQFSALKAGFLRSMSDLYLEWRCFHTSYGIPSGPAAVPVFELFRAFRRSSLFNSEFSGEEDRLWSFWLSGMAFRVFSRASFLLGSVG